MLSHVEKLRAAQAAHRSVLCVGLDPDPALLPLHLRSLPPVEAVVAFNTAIIEATAAYACAFKLNLAFFEVLGREGWDALARTLAVIPPSVVTIADAKRGDIGNSARFYARAIFDMGFDAVTVAPYMGADSVAPFLQYPGRAAYVLARTSNAGAADFQERDVDGQPLYLRVAKAVDAWGRTSEGAAGLVVGATEPSALAAVRAACPTLPFLIPGVGAQGGEPAAVVAAAETTEGPILVNSSRQILYASDGPDFAVAAEDGARALRDLLAQARGSSSTP